MTDEARALVRAAAVLAVGIALVLAGIAIGANLWPKVVKVEQRVVERTPTVASAGGILSRLPDVVQAACPAVVALKSGAGAAPPPAPRRKKGARRAGAAGAGAGPSTQIGFFISPDGFLLTPAAGLPQSGDIAAALNDGRELAAHWVRSDPLSGLALLKVDAGDLPYLELAQQTFPRVGDVATAIASPEGTGCSARLALVGVDFLAEAPGTSAYVRMDPAPDARFPGAPLVGADGRVAAIAGAWPDDPGAAMPAEVAARVAGLLLRDETPPEAAAGLLIDDLSPQLATRLGAGRQQGAAVLLVAPGSPAGLSGLRAGDVILSAGGAPVSSASELGRAIDAQAGTMPLQLLRRGTTMTIELLAARGRSGR
jgi:serine protease Do